MAKVLTVFGLVVAFIGVVFLYFYAVPSRDSGGLTVYGPIALQHNAGGSDRLEEAGKYVDRAARLSRLGFGLVAVGTLLQTFGTLAS